MKIIKIIIPVCLVFITLMVSSNLSAFEGARWDATIPFADSCRIAVESNSTKGGCDFANRLLYRGEYYFGDSFLTVFPDTFSYLYGYMVEADSFIGQLDTTGTWIQTYVSNHAVGGAASKSDSLIYNGSYWYGDSFLTVFQDTFSILFGTQLTVIDSLFIPEWTSAPATGTSGLFGADTANDSIIAFIGGTRAVVYPHPPTASSDSATYADTVFGQVGSSGNCIDAYIDSIFGCSDIYTTADFHSDENIYADTLWGELDTTGNNLITYVANHKGIGMSDSAIYADTVYGQVGKSGACIDAYIDSIFGCSDIYITANLHHDENLYGTADNKNILWDGEKIHVDYDGDDDTAGIYFHNSEAYIRYMTALGNIEVAGHLNPNSNLTSLFGDWNRCWKEIWGFRHFYQSPDSTDTMVIKMVADTAKFLSDRPFLFRDEQSLISPMFIIDGDIQTIGIKDATTTTLLDSFKVVSAQLAFYIAGTAYSTGGADGGGLPRAAIIDSLNLAAVTMERTWTFEDSIRFRSADDTIDIYLSHDTLLFNSKVGNAYLDLSELIVLFGSGVFKVDNLQPATNDSSTSNIGTPTAPFGSGDYTEITVLDSLVIPHASAKAATATTGMLFMTTNDKDSIWVRGETNWICIGFEP